jgi:hypothetical protein
LNVEKDLENLQIKEQQEEVKLGVDVSQIVDIKLSVSPSRASLK